MHVPADEPSRWAGLHVLADDDPRWPRGPVEQAEAASRGGAHVVQLRAKHAPDRTVLSWAKEIRAITRRSGTLFVMNDRFDLALAAEADGVHLGQSDLPPRRVATVAGHRLAIGRSTHTLEQAQGAAHEPIDYVAFGPLFGTQSKDSEYAARGTDRLEEVVALVKPYPVVAIGGITQDNLAGVVRAGAAGAAVISAVAAAADPVAATRALLAVFDEGGKAEANANE